MPVEFRDYYATLGIARDASEDQIKKAFRQMARKYHPDVASDKKAAEEKFKEINEAYEVLSDPEKRKKYDRLGARWQDEGAERPPPEWKAGNDGAGHSAEDYEFHFNGTGFSDFFEQFFSGNRGSGFGAGGQDFGRARPGAAAERPRRGRDIEADILVTLEEAMHGTQRPLSLQAVDPQTGQVETHTFQVRIPPGAIEGRRIRVPGKGQQGLHGGPAGDLYLRVRHAAHLHFRTREADVYHDLDLAPWDAVLGAQIVVPTLDGSIKLRIPPGTSTGQQLRVRGRGLPKDKAGARGDFLVIVNIQVPQELTDEERSHWEKLKAVSHFNPQSSQAT